MDLSDSAIRELLKSHTPSAVADLICEKALEGTRSSADFLCRIATRLLDIGQADIASEVLYRALDLDSRHIDSLHCLALASRASGRPEDARGYCEDAIAFSPDTSCLLDIDVSNVPNILAWIRDRQSISLTKALISCLKILGELRSAAESEELAQVVRTIAIGLADTPLSEQPAHAKLVALAHSVGFSRGAARTWTALVFETLMAPTLNFAAQCGFYDLALNLEILIYNEFVLQTETEEHFRRTYQTLAPVLEKSGRDFALSLPVHIPENGYANCVGFILNNSTFLAHTDVLINYLENFIALHDQRITPIVYILFGPKDQSELAKRLASMEIRVHWMDEEHSGREPELSSRMGRLRGLTQETGVKAVVWISVVPFMVFAFAMRLAPVQIWWAMKYHALETPDIDGYVTGWTIGNRKLLGDRIWHSGRMGMLNWYEGSLSNQAMSIRHGFGLGRLLIGSFGREEKLDNEIYLQSICNVLRKNENAIFLWTGRKRLDSIDAAFQVQGVSHQTHFIGWVNTRLYAQVIDLFADSFPFPCGFTALQAMAASKPIVLFNSPEARETGIHGMIGPVLAGQDGTANDQLEAREIFTDCSGNSLYFCAENSEEYEMRLQTLIDDRELRLRTGIACKAYVERFFSDPIAMAQSFTNHFLEIIREKDQEQ